MKKYDVVIVGFGPTGGTLANLLALQGFAILVLAGLWWFLPDESNICHRYLDGRYSYKTAEKKWIGRGERYGSEFGLIDNCRDKIPYVDPDKLITNKEGFWDTFYNKHIQGLLSLIHI